MRELGLDDSMINLKNAIYTSSIRAFRRAEGKSRNPERACSMAQMVANFAATLLERTIASNERGTRSEVHMGLRQNERTATATT